MVPLRGGRMTGTRRRSKALHHLITRNSVSLYTYTLRYVNSLTVPFNALLLLELFAQTVA